MLKPKSRLSKKKIKEDKLVTFYFNAIEYYNKYQNYILGGLAAVVVLVLVSVYFSNMQTEKEGKASGKLAVARMHLSQMNTKVAIDTLEAVISEFSGTNSAGVACFYLANTYFQQQNTESAQIYYQKYLDDYDDDALISSSSLAGVAACLEQKKEYKEAAKLYEKSTQKYPQVFDSADKLMSAARCYRLAGIKENAKKIYEQVIEEYPNSGYKNDAELFLAQLEV